MTTDNTATETILAEALAPAVFTAPAVSNPLYRQIKALILDSLHSGEWKPAEAIPSEMDLAMRYGVSQGTVRKAVDELAVENLLTRRQGKGTFVATHAEQQMRYRFLRLQADSGAAQSEVPAERHIVDCTRVKAKEDVANLLGLQAGDTVLQLRRVLGFQGSPTIWEEIYLPAPIFKGLTLQRLREDTRPMYAFFEAEFGVSMVRADERLKATGASDLHVKHLLVKLGTPLLFVERVSYTYQNRPMELRRAWYKTDKHHYFNALQ